MKSTIERLGVCPVCSKAEFILEELTPVGDNLSEWRVSCYGCNVSTFRTPEKAEAMKTFRTFVTNLERLRCK